MDDKIKYRVKLVSKDENVFLFTTKAISEQEAIEKARQKIINNEWGHHQYQYDSIEKLHRSII